MSADVEIAPEKAKTRVGGPVRKALTARDQTNAIYQELRAFRAERIAAQTKDDPGPPVGRG